MKPEKQKLAWRKLMPLAVLLASCCGCLKVKEQLTIQENGSGTVHIETQSLVPVEQATAMSSGLFLGQTAESGAWLSYPPLNKAAALKLFPGNGFTVKVAESKTDKGDAMVTVDVTFKEINALLQSPYGRAHSLTLKKDGNALAFQSLSGLQLIAQMAGMKNNGMGIDEIMGMQPDLQKRKNELFHEFALTLPREVSASNGSRAGKVVTWTMDRSKMKDDAEATRAFSTTLEASCGADGLAFTPISPTRLALTSFSDLKPGSSGTSTQTVDEKKVSGATRFVPCKMQVTRSMDLSGRGGWDQNHATLTGVILVPNELAPQQWGAAIVEEVVDDKGHNLKPTDEEGTRFSQSYGQMMIQGENGEGEEEADSEARKSEARHTVTLNFKAPDWKSSQIVRLRGSVEMQYFASSEIVKIENAVAADQIKDISKGDFGSFNGRGQNLSNARLTELGTPIKLLMAMRTSGMTTLSLQSEGKNQNSAITDVQVFDATGKAWSSFLQPQDMGENMMYQVMVAGDPPPPLSLALALSGVSRSVKVPILLEKVPLMSAEKSAQAGKEEKP